MSRPPNILWFSLEDTSPTFGCYGDPVARTPHLDALAAEGCVFERAFAIAGVCAPSRNGIITGRYATANGAHHMRTGHARDRFDPLSPTPYACVPPPHVKAFTESLRAAGYFCTNCDKTDYQFGVPSSAWDRCARDAHWRQRSPGQPFFAVFNPTRTHESGHWEPEGAEELPIAPEDVSVQPFLPDTPAVRRAIARHHRNVAASDAELGRILDELRADGLLEDTIIFIWSDHGMGLPRFKRWPNDTGTRVPLIVRAPGLVEPGTRSRELVSLIDLGPTVLALAGVDRPAQMHGRVFLGPHRDEPRDCVFAARDRYDESFDKVRSVRDARYRYVRNFYPQLEREIFIPYRNRHPAMRELWNRAAAGTLAGAQEWFAPGPRRPEELYDLDADPWELVNVIDDPAHRPALRRLRAALDEWQIRHDPWLDVPEHEMVARWHPQGVQPTTAPPFAIALGADEPGREPLPAEAAFSGAVLTQLSCGTEGASIEYQLDAAAEDGRWRLYAGPIRLAPGRHELRARAIRYGYAPSEEVRWQLTVAG